ncbi:MAG: energy transducer TonB [Verrucomicrobiales bacterium]|nr:energy transducer TonB [Verrucomicrobiales bacterium]
MSSKAAIAGGDLLRVATALGLTAGLLLFLAGMRLTRTSQAPVLTLRHLNTISPVNLPAPPPPPATETPPPPPPPDLPRLDLKLDPGAPPVKATLARKIELRLNPSDFAPLQEAPLAQMVFSAADLDSMPRLVNRPSIVFPAELKAKGLTQVKVVLDVNLSAGGIVTVQRVLESPGDDFTAVARSYATKARFTPPKKDGRAVQASFRWPLIRKR